MSNLTGPITNPELMAVYLSSQADIFKYIPGGITVSNGWETPEQLTKMATGPGGSSRLMAICHESQESPANIRGRFLCVNTVTLWCSLTGHAYAQIYLLQSCAYIRDLFNEASIYSTDFPDMFDESERGRKSMVEIKYMGRTHVHPLFSGEPNDVYNLTFMCAQSGTKLATNVARNVR